MALGRVVQPRRAIAASSAREGEKARNMSPGHNFCAKSRNKLILDVLLVVDYDSELKNRCYHCRFRVNYDSHTFTARIFFFFFAKVVY